MTRVCRVPKAAVPCRICSMLDNMVFLRFVTAVLVMGFFILLLTDNDQV